MKKILLILILFPIFVEALGSNGSTSAVSTTGAASGCNGYVWYLGANAIPPEGVRVTFYNLRGKQLGHTIDVFNQRYIYASNTSYDVHVTCDESIKYNRFYRCEGSSKVNYISYTPSRLDYVNGIGKSVRPVSGGQNDSSKYVYYVDANFDRKRDYNPLTYTKDDDGYQNAKFKNYFTSPGIVDKYMKLAGIDDIDPYTSSEYLFLLEPIVPVTTCGTGSLGASVLSTADIAYWMSNYQLSGTLNCGLARSLSLVEAGQHAKIGNIEFSVPKLKTCNNDDTYSKEDRTTNKVGIGMYLIYGDQICKNCGNRAVVVYHTINLNQPFLDIDGNIRVLDSNSNWYQQETTIDVDIYKKSPQYTVVLTPTVMKQIRADNKNIKYSELSDETFEKFKQTYAIFR